MIIQESPYLYLDEIREWLALYHDQPISMTALHNNLRRMGLSRKIMRKAAAERDPVARAEWLAYVTSTFSAEEMVIKQSWLVSGLRIPLAIHIKMDIYC